MNGETQQKIQVRRAIICRPDITTIVDTRYLAEMKSLILRRAKTKYWSGYWECPGGKVEGDETEIDTLTREVKQETGLIISPDICLAVGKYTGEPYNQLEAKVPNPDPVEYEVTYYLVSCLPGDPQCSEEHDESAWELPTHIVTDMRELVRPCTRNAVIHGVFTTIPSLLREDQISLLRK